MPVLSRRGVDYWECPRWDSVKGRRAEFNTVAQPLSNVRPERVASRLWAQASVRSAIFRRCTGLWRAFEDLVPLPQLFVEECAMRWRQCAPGRHQGCAIGLESLPDAILRDGILDCGGQLRDDFGRCACRNIQPRPFGRKADWNQVSPGVVWQVCIDRRCRGHPVGDGSR